MYISENKEIYKHLPLQFQNFMEYFLYFDVKYKPPASSTFSKCSDENQGMYIFLILYAKEMGSLQFSSLFSTLFSTLKTAIKVGLWLGHNLGLG